jgi:DNA-binding transcriptional MerR regulator
MADDSYDLLELCDAADVTPRTVRYYVQQGLLPSPDTRGRGAKYDRTHLERIQLIKRLQARHLPLAEIRNQLAELSDAAVSALVTGPSAKEKSGSALRYVRSVLGETKGSAAPGGQTEKTASGAPDPLTIPMRELPTESRSTWDRIAFSPDIELHIRRPLSRGQNKLLERLIEYARSLFSDSL